MQDELREQQVTLNDYIRVLFRGRWIIAISFFIVVAATTYFTFTMQPVYEATALIMLKEDAGVQQQLFEVSSFMKKETMINNHVEILKSRTLAEEVIRRLLASSRADSLYILGFGQDENEFSFQRWLKSLISGSGAEQAGPMFDEYVKHFRENVISIVPKRDTDMIELKAQAPDPHEASFIANTWMRAYRDLDISDSRGEVKEVKDFLEDKVHEIKEELTHSEEALREFKESEGVTELSVETQQLIQQLANFETLHQEAQTDLQANEKRLAFLNSQLTESQKVLMAEAVNLSSPVIQELEIQLGQLIGRRASLQQQVKGAGFDTEYSNLEELDQRIKGLQDKILEETRKMVSGGGSAINPRDFSENLFNSILEIETENKSLNAKTLALGKIVRQYNRELNKVPGKGQTLARLQREATVNNNIYMMMREKFEENRIAEAGQIGSVRIVDRAMPPDDPIKPKKKMNILLGIMVGLGLGIGITFGREYLDNSLKTIEDVERLDFTVMGTIPFITTDQVVRQAKKNGNGEASRIESRLITHFAPKSPISEAYRTLRTNIQYTHPDRPTKAVMVTSSGPGEGKSTSVANLAITFAQMGSKVLLVDTDLRRPVQHGIFGMERDIGITNVLVGKASLEEAIKKTSINGFHLLTAGTLPPNPSELLSSKNMKTFIEETKEKFDLVLFDSPPVIAVTDAAVLANQLDGVLLVLKSGNTNRDALIRSRQLLENVNANILGVLVNGIHVDHMYGSYYYYYQHYYYGDGKKKKKRV